MADIVRCKKCGIPGAPHQVAHHEPTCKGERCLECQGYGVHFFAGCTGPANRTCEPCEGTGIKGGRAAIWKLREEAIERYRADMAECR